MKKSSLVFAFDGPRKNDEFDLNGVTAERYGVGGYPTNLIIDREGKIAFRSNDPGNMPAMQRAVKEMGLDTKTINEEQASQLIERLLDQAIEGVLTRAIVEGNRPDRCKIFFKNGAADPGFESRR